MATVAIALAGCGKSEQTEVSQPPPATSARFVERSVIHDAQPPLRSAMTGAFDWENRTGWAIERGFGPRKETRQIGDACYRRTGSGPWRRSQANDVGGTCDAALFSDPAKAFDLYEKVADARTLGKDQVRGVETTHYRAELNIGAVKGPLDLWVDAYNVVRRSRQRGAQANSFVTTREYYDFGVEVAVSIPEGAG